MELIELGDSCLRKTVLALGFFDSIHIGHRKIIELTVQRAESLNAVPAVFTFANNPNSVLGKETKLVYTFEERCGILKELGVGAAIYSVFDKEFMNIAPYQFMGMIEKLNPVLLICGFDYRFGKDAGGGPKALAEYFSPKGIGVFVADKVCENGLKVGTTRIKQLLQSGDVETANRLLGQPYRMRGLVYRGFGVGSSILGFPTVNLKPSQDKLAIKTGVYAGSVQVFDQKYRAIINVGCRPTFEDGEIKTEAHLLDFDGDLYDCDVTVFFDRYLRETKKFDSPEALSAQLERDRRAALNLCGASEAGQV